MNNPFVIGIISWLLPGAGHLLQKRFKRGLIVGAVVWGMFLIAVLSGGIYYPGFEFKDGALLYVLNIFARLGTGIGGLISFFLMTNAPANIAQLATFEYGGRFLEIAGLLNYLAVMDAIDIHLGRKK